MVYSRCFVLFCMTSTGKISHAVKPGCSRQTCMCSCHKLDTKWKQIKNKESGWIEQTKANRLLT